MVSLDKARIVKYEKNNNNFEVYVEPDLALSVKENEKKYDDVYNNLFAVEEVYKDAKKGERQSDKTLQDNFGTNDFRKIAEEILLKGRLDLTTEQKKRIAEARKKEIVNYIVANSINPITNTPHPPQRVEAMLEKAKVDIDLHKSVQKQIDKIIEKLKPFLPMTFQKVKFRVKIPTGLAGKVNGILNKYDVLERKWQSDAFVCLVSVPIGLKDNFLKTISGLTQGKALFEIEE